MRWYIWGSTERLTPWIVIQAIFYWLFILCYIAFLILCGIVAFKAMDAGM